MGLLSSKLGLRALSSSCGPKSKFLLGLKLWGFLAVLGTSPEIPVPASLCTLAMPSGFSAPLPLAHRSTRASLSIPVSPALSPQRPLGFCSCGSSLPPPVPDVPTLAEKWQQTGTETSLCLWNIHRKNGGICPKPGAAKSKGSVEGNKQGELARVLPASQDYFSSKAPLEGSGPFLLPQVRPVQSQGLFRALCSQVGAPARPDIVQLLSQHT